MTALPAHVLLEAYSVLTRLPSGLAVPPDMAADVLADRFDDPPLDLPSPRRATLLRDLAGAGVRGGAVYDGLVALEASAHDAVLLTLDQRAVATYQRLGVRYRFVGGD